MAFSITVNTIRFSARIAVNDNVSNTMMMQSLSDLDPEGTRLDMCDGNVKGAFAMLVADKFHSMAEVHKDNSIEVTCRRFNLYNRKLPPLHTGDDENWSVRIISIKPSPSFEVKTLEQSA
ncbi:hypothetical protein [Pseudoalteromonas sp. T1lg10]|uniref:hypothetical protein n=1 Tax=Pseudoalteromonas sp. T1lg10 TaxID=2077093 RepID=UPI000CF66B6B|nr:hypothetical protein [Pseudoalteromonas sp. T1lg10]